jgi:translation elongation factor EF-G
VAAVREWYGSNVAIGPPRVRYQLGEVVREPVMSLVIRAPKQFAIAVKNDLLRRGAEAVNLAMYPAGFIARAQATQAELLGYPAWLAELCGGRAELHLWLSHYAPVDQGPGPEAA